MQDQVPLKVLLGLVIPKGIAGDRQFLWALSAGCLLSLVIGAMAAGTVTLERGLIPALSLILWYPLVEELAFRGLVQGWLAQRLPDTGRLLGLSTANLLTAVLFVGWHLLYRSDVLAWLVLVPALVFGYFRERHDSLVPPVILHCLYNACLLPGWYLLS